MTDWPSERPPLQVTRRQVATALVLVVVGLILWSWRSAMTFLTDWMWFRSVGYGSVFVTTYVARIGLGVVAAILLFGLLAANLYVARRASPGHLQPLRQNVVVLSDTSATQTLYWLAVALLLVVSIVFGGSAAGRWHSLLLALRGTAFGVNDPVFDKDIGYYVFQYPFQEWLCQQLLLALCVAIGFTVIAYILSAAIRLLAGVTHVESTVKVHLSLLLALLFLVKAWGYRLQMFRLLYSKNSNFWGAGWTDLHVRLPILWLLIALSLGCAVILLVNLRRQALKPLAVTVCGMIIVSLLAGSGVPALVQKLVVSPNELTMELPYIRRSIKYARKAYGLDRTATPSFPAEDAPSLPDLKANELTLKSVRLWDHRPLAATYRQLQEIRQYYQFYNVDLDRYLVNGEYRQVAVAPRELASEKLQNQTWITRHVMYTHGYGLCMSPVNAASPEGQPFLWVKDIPPASSVPLEVKRPEIYFGESPSLADYVLVRAKTAEFDYPKGNDNVTCQYVGGAGIRIRPFLSRIAFATRFADVQLLVTQEIGNDTRILIYRNIRERLQRLAPFLSYDGDPYVAVWRGKLIWVADAYTLSTRFPYSPPSDLHERERMNYIRNAVKATVDPYTGETRFYIADGKDPIIRAYRSIFPSLFRDLSEMPPDLRAHIRYPVDMLRAQANVYTLYHMIHAQTLYSGEDQWRVAEETYATTGTPIPMEPYYAVLRLPGAAVEEFVLMIPFTPQNRQNLIGWMCARCDGRHYGELVVYQFSKQKNIYGPMQVEALVNQHSEISKVLTLWDQKGSEVIRGNMLVIPIERSLIYVQPLYLKAASAEMPELKSIIVGMSRQVEMGNTLSEAVAAHFGGVSPGGAPSSAGGPLPGDSLRRLINDALSNFQGSQRSLRDGDWADFGAKSEVLGQRLLELQKITRGTGAQGE